MHEKTAKLCLYRNGHKRLISEPKYLKIVLGTDNGLYFDMVMIPWLNYYIWHLERSEEKTFLKTIFFTQNGTKTLIKLGDTEKEGKA